MDELVSIIVPVYNVEKYILETIDCVRKQTYTDWEMLLVEDGSRDNTVAVVEEFLRESGEERVRLIRLPENVGAAKARNHGVQQSKGRYVAYLDADDLWRPEKLEKELAYLKAKDAAFVFTGYEFADENGVGTGKVVRVPEMLDYKKALGNTTIFTSTVIFDTNRIPKEQIMMPDVKSEDTALWWDILRSGRVAYGLDENLVFYRRPGKSLSSNKLEAIRRIWKLYRRERLPLWKCVLLMVKWGVLATWRRV